MTPLPLEKIPNSHQTGSAPFEIIEVNDNNAKIKIKNKLKVVNIARLKPFMEEPTQSVFLKMILALLRAANLVFLKTACKEFPQAYN
jgi:hypothetical protein